MDRYASQMTAIELNKIDQARDNVQNRKFAKEAAAKNKK